MCASSSSASCTAAVKMLRPMILCGPSGSGKSTLLEKLLIDFPNRFGFSVSHTTRPPRKGEIDGQHYHFTNRAIMTKAIEAGKFIESASFSGNLYGTSKASVEKVAENGQVCILDIEVQGVRQIKATDFNPWYIFIKPPSLDVLEARLRARKTETEESLKKRLRVADSEIVYGTQPGNFDLVIVNDELEKAYGILKQFIVENVLPK